jgi:hypothetical protein
VKTSDDDFPRMQAPDMEDRIAALVAGDLEADERLKTQAALGDDADLTRQRDFWREVHSVLPAAARPDDVPLPGPGMAEVLRRRLAAEREESVIPGPGSSVFSRRAFGAAGWLVAAAAVLALAVIVPLVGGGGPAPVGIAYAEDGSAARMSPGLDHQGFSAITTVHADRPVAVDAQQAVSRPWIGLWSRPVELVGLPKDAGLLVVRVAEESPAAKAGLRPGDVILGMDDVPMFTRNCIRKHIADDQPGSPIQVNFWRSGDETLDTTLYLGACLE